MLFNSYEFLLLFLPVCLAGYFLLGQRGKVWGAVIPLLNIVLPIGISFFTFTQIAFRRASR